VLQFPDKAESFGRAIAEAYSGQGIQLVASPAIGGIVIGHEVARALGARFIWTEREAGAMTLRRGFMVSPGERTLVVEDVITTGGSTRETIEALRRGRCWRGVDNRSLGGERGCERAANCTRIAESVVSRCVGV
jgi:orotate phosphoribosyltransferase